MATERTSSFMSYNRRWYTWVLWVLWLALLIFFIDFSVGSLAEREPLAAGISFVVTVLLLVAALVYWFIGGHMLKVREAGPPRRPAVRDAAAGEAPGQVE